MPKPKPVWPATIPRGAVEDGRRATGTHAEGAEGEGVMQYVVN